MQCVSSQNYKTTSTVRNKMGSNVGWAESAHSDCAGGELKIVRRGAREAWGLVLFSDQWQWVTVDPLRVQENDPSDHVPWGQDWNLGRRGHRQARIDTFWESVRGCARVREVHLLSDRPQQQQHDGCVGLWSITDVWQADELWRSHTASSTRSPSSACLLISSGGGRKLSPSFSLTS